jgi:hypothetical protein
LNSPINRFIISIGIFLLSVLFIDYLAAFGVAIALYVSLSFFDKLSYTLPVKQLLLFIAGLQWIVGPIIEYLFFNTDTRYRMYVEEAEYFSYIIPAFLAFGIGFSINGLKKIKGNLEFLEHYKTSIPRSTPYIFIFIGFISGSIGSFMPPSLRFVFFLLSGLKYIGLLYFFLWKDPKRWLILGGLLVLTAAGSLAMGMFHDLLLWGVLLFLYIAFFEKFTTFQKLAIVVVGLSTAYIIQMVKAEYRQTITTTSQASNADVFVDLASRKILSEADGDVSESQNIVTRMNQGWIISRVMYYVPEYTPYAEGETINEALKASLLPRFLDPNKKKAGGQENFERFTGLYLSKTTSMGTSIIGEAYANYGKMGGVIFMFIWGFVLSLVLVGIINLSAKYPTLILWIPLIFLQVIKAETELVVVLNHLVKALMLVSALFVGFRIFGYRL